jgi:hypothetical protein
VRNHRGDDELAVPVDPHPRPARGDATRNIDRRVLVTPRGQSSGLAGGVDATHLHRHRGDARQAQHQYHHQAGDREGCLNGAATGTRT